jgi:hypothetical protein
VKLTKNGIHGCIGENERIASTLLHESGQHFLDGADILRMDKPISAAHICGSLRRRRPTSKASEKWAPAGADFAAPTFHQFTKRTHHLVLQIRINILTAKDMFERFEQGLVEVEMKRLRLFLQDVTNYRSQDFN